MKIKYTMAMISVLFLMATTLYAGESTAPDNAEAYFINLKDGDVVKSPFLIQFGLRNFGVAPALVDWPNTGHFHLIIDGAPVDYNAPIPETKAGAYIHYGLGQIEGTVSLPPGKHTLQILMADHEHVPHTPVVKSKVITITVE